MTRGIFGASGLRDVVLETMARLLLAALLAAFTGCRMESPTPASTTRDRFVLLEHVRVTGSCFVDNGGEPARYAGFVERWHDGRKDRDLLHGSVSNLDRLVETDAKKPRPPAFIQFGEVAADQLAGNRLVLKGFAEGRRPSEATCTLDVAARQRPAPGDLSLGPAARGPVESTVRRIVGLAALLLAGVAGVWLVRHQVRRTAAPWLLAIALLLLLISLLLP